ncbi:CPBP family intramembrane metalloprotease [Dactylosporangium sp. NBC_01737]|uniref:CPBP family intramembrane glutamic endopeptidase n=1 Tax=Dactylosporangium sp. NBC_01737 TaxID=2975959 RepID=UPI002E165756|nr:CPBP family intramembrane metalloprotease [Dactylosporangium sp. NBC_01737]
MTPALSWPRAVALHLLPGLAGLALFAAAAPVLAAAGLPPVWGMYAAVLLVLAPIELTLVRRLRGPDGIDTRWPRPRRLILLLAPTLAAAALAPGLVQWLEPGLHDRLHLPSWWRLDPMLSDPARPAWQHAVTIAGWLLCFVVVGPVVEELYFRGLLMPRLPTARPAVASAVLFALYHAWQPYAWLTVAVFALPLAVAARRPRGLAVAALTHVLVNLLAFAVLAAGTLHR